MKRLFKELPLIFIALTLLVMAYLFIDTFFHVADGIIGLMDFMTIR